MKKSIRAFSIGLFTAGVVSYFWPAPQAQVMEEEIANYQKQINHLTDELEVAQQLQVSKKPQDTRESKDQVTEKQETQVKGTIFIYETISLYDIGKQAEDIGIVKVGRELELFLSKPEYARIIQKGQFELTSDMTFEEIAQTLTGAKK